MIFIELASCLMGVCTKKVYTVCLESQVERYQGNCRLKYKWYTKNQALYCPMQGAGTPGDPNIGYCCPRTPKKKNTPSIHGRKEGWTDLASGTPAC